MRYNVYSRPKQSRNKYGWVNNQNIVGGNSSSFYGNGDSTLSDVETLLDNLSDFVGATEYEPGVHGLVPAPPAGSQDDHFLKADGTWAYDPAYKWLHEWPEDDPRGLEIDGDFNVTGTLSTMDLNVQGTAHFWELCIDRVKATGGQLIVSPSLFEVDWVGGTQIYDFGFTSSPYTHTSTFQGKLKDDVTQWTDLSDTAQTYYPGKVVFFNTVERNFTKDELEYFCNGQSSIRRFLGTGVHWDNGGDGDTGWGGKYPGYFNRDLRAADGSELPLTEGLPYDWDEHWLDYYNLDIPSDWDTGLVYEEERIWFDGITSWRPYIMNAHAKQDFLDLKFHTHTDWSKIVQVRPDIYYRFFTHSIDWTYLDLDGFKDKEEYIANLPKDSEWSRILIPYVWDSNNNPVKFIDALTWIIAGGVNTYDDGWKIQYFAKRCWMRCDDGTRRTFNECQIGDMLRCKSFNIKEGVYHNVSNKDFWTFVVGTGEGSFTDDEGATHEAFFVDLVYAMKYVTPDGYQYYPIGTVFKNRLVEPQPENFPGRVAYVNPLDATHEVDTNIDIPAYWDQNMVQILNLKKVSKNTLCGLVDVIEEFPTDEEFSQAVDLVISIRGGINNIDQLAGIDIQNGRSMNDIRRLQELVAYLNGQSVSSSNRRSITTDEFTDIYGRPLPTSAGDLVELTRVGLFSSDGGEGSYTPEEIDEANYISFLLTKGGMDGSDIEEASEEGEQPENIEIGDSQVQAYTEEGRKLKLNETHHNYSGKDYYSQYKFGYGKYDVRVGDDFACLGNLYDQSRMNAIVISATTPLDPEITPPSICQYHLIDMFGVTISRFRYTTIAKSGNSFFGTFQLDTGRGAYMDIDSEINLFLTDIYTGLETVGIHLDGPSSTIKMIGNIELHQHADGDDDTLSIWDSDERKRLEMIPREIPTRASQDSLLSNTEKHILDAVYTDWVAGRDYIYYNKQGTIVGGWLSSNWGRRADYALNVPPPWNGSEMPRFCFSVNGSVNLGQYNRSNTDDKYYIDLSSLNLKVDTTDCKLIYNGTVERNLTRDFNFAGSSVKAQNLILTVRTFTGDVLDTLTVAQPQVRVTEEGKVINISLVNDTFFNDIELPFRNTVPPSPSDLKSAQIWVDFVFDVYPYAEANDLSRSDNYSFSGRAITTGSFNVTGSERTVGGEDVSTSLSQMVIGTNGMVFNNSNSQYFYASSDGFELKWDDAAIRVDDKKGLYLKPKVWSIYSSVTNSDCPENASVGIGDGCILPYTALYGTGRIFYAIGVGSGVGLKTKSGEKMSIFIPAGILNPNGGERTCSTLKIGSTLSYDSVTDTLTIQGTGNVELISLGNGIWAIIGGVWYTN